MTDSDFSLSPYDDPRLQFALEQEMHSDVRDLVRRLHQAGEHRFAAALEVEAWGRAGITAPEVAARLGRVPPRGWLIAVLERVGLRETTAPPEIW
jgi:hypothetical protein